MERWYAIIVLVVSLFVMAVLVGQFGNLLANIGQASNYKFHQLWLLRRYMTQLKVSKVVAEKVDTYVQFVLTKQLQEVDGDNIEVLKLLSKPLAIELKADSYNKYTNTHKLFKYCTDRYAAIVSIAESLSTNWMSGGSYIFQCGERHMDLVLFIDMDGTYYPDGDAEADLSLEAERCCHTCGTVFPEDSLFCRRCGGKRKHGTAHQDTEPQNDAADLDAYLGLLGGFCEMNSIGAYMGVNPDPDPEPEVSVPAFMSVSSNRSDSELTGISAPAGVWIGEPTLWTSNWYCLGDLKANGPGQVAQIHPKTFQAGVRLDLSLWETMSKYATEFVKHLNRKTAEVLTDLSVTVIDPQDILEKCGLEDHHEPPAAGGFRQTFSRQATDHLALPGHHK